MARSSDETRGGSGQAPADALAHGFRALITALEEGFQSSWASQRSLNEAGEAVTLRGVQTLMQAVPASAGDPQPPAANGVRRGGEAC